MCEVEDLAVVILGPEGAEPLDLQLLQAAAGHVDGREVSDRD